MSVYRMLTKPLSDSDLRKILGPDTKIIEYVQLNSYSDLNTLLPKPVDFVIILYEEKKLSGHWTCLAKRNNLFSFFDSYGLSPDSELKWFSPKQKQLLGEDKPLLSRLLQFKKYEYNKVDYQSHSPTTQTCGSHCALFLFLFQKFEINVNQYNQIVNQIVKQTHESYDQIASRFTDSILKQ